MTSIFLVITFVTAAFYFFPTIIAMRKNHHNTEAIFLLNCLFGWTFIGWVASLIWASTNKGKR